MCLCVCIVPRYKEEYVIALDKLSKSKVELDSLTNLLKEKEKLTEERQYLIDQSYNHISVLERELEDLRSRPMLPSTTNTIQPNSPPTNKTDTDSSNTIENTNTVTSVLESPEYYNLYEQFTAAYTRVKLLEEYITKLKTEK